MSLAFKFILGSTATFDGMLFDLIIKATLILIAAVAASAGLRRSSAALRHLTYGLALLALLLLPIFSRSLPNWRIAIPVSFQAEKTPANPPMMPAPTATPTSRSNAAADGSYSTGELPSPVAAISSAGAGAQTSEADGSGGKLVLPGIWALVWLIGVCTLLISTIVGLLRARQLRLLSTEVSDPDWLHEFVSLISERNWLQRVQLLQNPSATVPMVCGILQPAIILPFGFRVERAEERRRILTHELAHIQRWDIAIHVLGRIACSLYWFHPLAWWCLRKMQQEREYACDDWVLASGSRASEYAEQLFGLAQGRLAVKKSLPGTIGIIQSTRLEQRIRLLLSDNVSHAQLTGTVLGTVVATFVLVTALVASAEPYASGAAKADREREATDRSGQPERVSAGVRIACIDQMGSPVADAEVHLYQETSREDGKTEYVHYGPYKSSKDGKVHCPDGQFTNKEHAFDRWVYARVPGQLVGVARSVTWNNRTPHNVDCVVKLQPSHTVRGKVHLPEGFDPTAVQVRVQVLNVFEGAGEWDFESFPRHLPFAGLDKALPEIFTQRPDGQGQFQFNDVPVRGRLYLLAECKGLGQGQWSNQSNHFDTAAEINMKPEGQLKGQVQFPDGRPAQGMTVSARIISEGNRGVAFETTFQAVTDMTGHFSFTGLPDWDFGLSATDREKRWVLRPKENLRVNSGQATFQTLVLEPSVRVSGRVLDSAGHPVEGAALSAIVDSQIGSGLDDAYTGSDGRYTLRLPSGAAHLYFNALPPAFTYPEPQIVRQLHIAPGQADLENVDLTLPRKEEASAKKTVSAKPADSGSQFLQDILAASKPLLESLANQRKYRLATNELIRHVPLPFPPERMEYYRLGQPSQYKAIPAGPSAMTFRWNGTELSNWGMTFGDSNESGYDLAGVLDAVAGIKNQRLQGPPELLAKRLSGDWVVRDGGNAKAIVNQLDAVLNKDFKLNVRLTFRSVEQEVYVARGDYKLTPLNGEAGDVTTQFTDKRVTSDLVHIFAKGLIPSSGAGGGSGEFKEFLEWLGRWISVPIVNEVQTYPKREVSWRLHERSPFTKQMQQEDHDPEAVLRNVTKQTQLQFTKERRPVELLFIEKAPE